MSNPSAQIYQTPLTQVDTAQKEILGSIRWVKNKAYKYLKILNTGGLQAGAVGDAVIYTAGTGYDANQATLRPAEGDAASIVAGLLAGAVAGVQNQAYFAWVQVKGPAVPNQAPGGTPAQGAELTMTSGSTAGQLTTRLYAGTTPNIVGNGNMAAIFQATGKVILDCPL